MTYAIQEKHWQNGSFTVGFGFSNGIAHCEGFTMETVVSIALGLKYRILVKHPLKGGFWTMKGMEDPMSQDEIEDAMKKFYNGYLNGSEFIFEVFDNTGKELLFGTKFNAADRIPSEGYGTEHLVVTSFTWSFPLPEKMRPIAKKALEEHVKKGIQKAA